MFKNLKSYTKIFNILIKYKSKGFSMIEIMIVLVLIGIITTLGISTLSGSLSRGKIKVAQIKAYELSRLIDFYKIQFGNYPSNDNGWNALINPPDGSAIINDIPNDPWNNQYLYIYPGIHNLNSPDIVSRGPDGIFSTDDIGNWEK